MSDYEGGMPIIHNRRCTCEKCCPPFQERCLSALLRQIADELAALLATLEAPGAAPYSSGDSDPCFTCEGENGGPAIHTVRICDTCFGEEVVPAAAPAEERIWCMECGKSVSTPVPKGTIMRAWVECPECIEKRAAPAPESHEGESK